MGEREENAWGHAPFFFRNVFPPFPKSFMSSACPVPFAPEQADNLLLKPGMGGIHAIVPTSIVAFAAFVIGAKCGRPASEEIIRLFWGEGNGTS